MLVAVDTPPARYGADRRTNWPLIGSLVAGHVLVLWAAVAFDVVKMPARAPEPTVITLLPEQAPPPPAVSVSSPPESHTTASPVAPTPLVTPPPVVQLPAPAPPQVASVAAPPMVVAQAAPSAAPAAAVAEVAAAPITPPDVAAAFRDNPKPRFPPESRRLKETGTVKLRVLVDARGRVGEVRVATSSGFARLDREATETVKRWRFAPAEQAGTAVAAWVSFPMVFRLS